MTEKMNTGGEGRNYTFPNFAKRNEVEHIERNEESL